MFLDSAKEGSGSMEKLLEEEADSSAFELVRRETAEGAVGLSDNAWSECWRARKRGEGGAVTLVEFGGEGGYE